MNQMKREDDTLFVLKHIINFKNEKFQEVAIKKNH